MCSSDLAEYALNPSNKKTYGELLTVSEERTHVLDQLRELEKNVFLLYKDVTAYNSNNSELTWYEIEAKKQVEMFLCVLTFVIQSVSEESLSVTPRDSSRCSE